MTFLAIDIGNTRLKWAQYETARPGARLLAHGAETAETGFPARRLRQTITVS